MKKALISYLFTLVWLSGWAQTAELSPIKIYPSDVSTVTISTTANTSAVNYTSNEISVEPAGAFIKVVTKRLGTQYYQPPQFRDAYNNPYGITTAASVAGYRLAQLSMSTGGKLSVTLQPATYAAALSLVSALPSGVGALVFISNDESPGNAGTASDGSNPQTAYLYNPQTTTLKQIVLYPN